MTTALKTRNVRMISLQDWDALVEEVYGKPYSFQQQDGCKPRGIEWVEATLDEGIFEEYDFENDSIIEEVNGEEMGVSFKAWLARDPKQPLADEKGENRSWHIGLFWRRNFYPSVHIIAHDLCKRGLLPEGEFVIEIDW